MNHDAASSSNFVRRGRKFKIEVYFGWFWVSFRNTTDRSGLPIQKETQEPVRTDQNSRTGSKQMRNILSVAAPSWRLNDYCTTEHHVTCIQTLMIESSPSPYEPYATLWS
jgi:hypothetical protein